MFDSDGAGYSRGAIGLLHGFYSFDGVHPYMEREPGMSMFLAVHYFVFGIENSLALAITQAALFFCAAWFFCSRLAMTYQRRIAVVTFLLLLLSGSVVHTIFLAYRECLALILLLTFSGVFLEHRHRPAWWKVVLMGLLFGALILTYYTFIFFPPVFLLLWWVERRPLREAFVLLLLCYGLVTLWGIRNASYDGTFRIIDTGRTTTMWYIRGEQAERVRGLEPFRCLWSEYVSRDWTGRSDACSYNGLMHARWPSGTMEPAAERIAITREAQTKVRMHSLSYLNFSLFEILELHLPFVGGGFSRTFNVYAALSALVMYIGFFFGIPRIFAKENLLWTALMAYTTLVFSLTDATPRYLTPVLFCYALLAAVGYVRLSDWLRSRLA